MLAARIVALAVLTVPVGQVRPWLIGPCRRRSPTRMAEVVRGDTERQRRQLAQLQEVGSPGVAFCVAVSPSVFQRYSRCRRNR